MTTPETATREEITAKVIEWRNKRAERLAADKVAEALKKEESELKQFLISAMLKQKYEGLVVDGRITGASTKEQPVVTDRETLERYILDNRMLSLLQFRLSSATVKEMEAEGVSIPGVGKEPVYDLFDRKA